MTVLDLLIAAVKSNMDTVNPFNVQLQWDEILECYTIIKALGVENTSSHTWQLKIRRWTSQVNIYANSFLIENNQFVVSSPQTSSPKMK